MKAKSNQEDVIAAIELVCKELLNAETINRWYDSRERPLAKIMDEIGLDRHYSSFIYEELKEIGLIEKEGGRGNVRYKIKTSVIPDATATANNIYRRFKDKQSEAVPASKRSDLVPFRSKTKSAYDVELKDCKKKGAKVTKELARIPHLGQIVYALVNGYITEARITCVRFDEIETTKVRVDFTTALTETDELGENEVRVTRKNYCLRNIAFSVEELIKKLQQNIKKFK